MGTLLCRYIDHLSCNKKDLGIFYQNNPSFEGVNSVLSTCHRIEVIDVVDNTLPNFKINGYTSKQILGDRDICLRLAMIASGVESIILGEKFVFDQVKNAFKPQTTNPLIFKVVEESLDIAKHVRKQFDFYSHSDYSDIAIKFLKGAQNVVIIGSGMLAKAIDNKLNEDTTIVTRNLKAARREFTNVCKINNLPDTPFKCIIATTNSSKYKKSVNKFLNKSQCSLVIDLSAIPFIMNESKIKYISMYHKRFEKEIEKANSKLLIKVPIIKEDIIKRVYG